MSNIQYIRINESFKTMIQKLLLCHFECGGYLNIDGNEIVSFEIYSGTSEQVNYPQYKPCGDNRITFHTHPRSNMTQELKYVPPSPDDIISFTLANSYIYPKIKRTSLVFAEEGCYVLRVSKKIKPRGKNLKEYLREAFMVLYSIWSYYNSSIWINENILLHVFDLIYQCFGVEIKFYKWSEFHFIPVEYEDSDIEGYEDFDRNEIPIHRNLFTNYSEEQLLSYLRDYIESLKE